MHFFKKTEKFRVFRFSTNIHFRQKSFRKKLRIYMLFLYAIDDRDIFIMHKKTRTAVTKKKANYFQTTCLFYIAYHSFNLCYQCDTLLAYI